MKLCQPALIQVVKNLVTKKNVVKNLELNLFSIWMRVNSPGARVVVSRDCR